MEKLGRNIKLSIFFRYDSEDLDFFNLKRDTIPELGGHNRKSHFTHLRTHSGNNQLIIIRAAEITGSVYRFKQIMYYFICEVAYFVFYSELYRDPVYGF